MFCFGTARRTLTSFFYRANPMSQHATPLSPERLNEVGIECGQRRLITLLVIAPQRSGKVEKMRRVGSGNSGIRPRMA